MINHENHEGYELRNRSSDLPRDFAPYLHLTILEAWIVIRDCSEYQSWGARMAE